VKRKIIIILLPILLITGCDKKSSNSENKDASLFSVTSTETVDSVDSSNPKKTFHLFDENMVANFDGYKPCEYEDDIYIIKVRIPNNWTYKLHPEDDAISKDNSYPDCGLNLYKNTINMISISKFKASHNYQIEDFENNQEFTPKSKLKGILAYSIYNDNTMQGIIQFERSPLIVVFIKDINMSNFEENKQEIFNVLNSIEIIEK